MKKTLFHSRNKHQERYDFAQLVAKCAELAQYIILNPVGEQTIDFANAEAVKMLNKALLAHYYQIKFWDIPPAYLCPPIPGRADYILAMADILAEFNEGVIPKGKKIKGLDIGVGANCVYPIIGVAEYAWHFVGADIDSVAIKSAQNIVKFNENLKNKIDCRLQNSPKNFFEGIIKPNEFFDFSICNPPFHASAEEANEGSKRKESNLQKKKISSPNLNFGGKSNELWCDGGEARFIKLMILESVDFANQCFWFSTLVSQKEHLFGIYKTLEKVNATQIKTIEMQQGNKKSRFVAWTFFEEEERMNWQRNLMK